MQILAWAWLGIVATIALGAAIKYSNRWFWYGIGGMLLLFALSASIGLALRIVAPYHP